ncbi:MAG: tRNA guanosine(34) transglycosylase Tgt [Oscillospiraceae bacterium]|nr:tRNA guanosine(34) transglycosylase Tgt [Oscillospiraceae bacterium]
MFTLIKCEGKARRGIFKTPHGEIQTPAFMNVATAGAIKGAVSTNDLRQLECQVLLCNTYHLHVRPGDILIKEMGGLQRFLNWSQPILTDSGGYQVFSLTKLKDVTEEGVVFRSHVDGKRILMTPEKSMEIQSNLGSTIVMAFDECLHAKTEYLLVKSSIERTTRWLWRSKETLTTYNARCDSPNPKQLLFGINQGTIISKLRKKHMESILELDLDGYAIGGLAVGETHDQMYNTILEVEDMMPIEKPRYLMGVGTPSNIIECVARGIDLFDCVMPSRNARHGYLFTSGGIVRILNGKYAKDDSPIDRVCKCMVCRSYTKSYIRYLLNCGEMLGMRLCVLHNLHFFNNLMAKIRESIENKCFESFRCENTLKLGQKL